MQDFNPNGAAEAGSGVFGFPYQEEDSALILIPVPWEATCSYGGGASEAPQHIFDASMFVELFDTELKDFYAKGIAWHEQDTQLKKLSSDAQKMAKPIIDAAGVLNDKLKENKLKVDEACKKMNEWVESAVETQLQVGKKIGVIGGDHSIALGAIKSLCKHYKNLGILQVDAHADLRTEFESLKYSHASVMDNVARETDVKTIVQVGVRGFCQEEAEKIENSNGKIRTFYESDLSKALFSEKSWDKICDEIINALPENVYISFDIDGLDPSNCPNSGTPMPGGISYKQAIYLLRKIAAAKKIVGFDLVEVSCGNGGPECWDAIVAANLLYKLCGCALTSKY